MSGQVSAIVGQFERDRYGTFRVGIAKFRICANGRSTGAFSLFVPVFPDRKEKRHRYCLEQDVLVFPWIHALFASYATV